MLSNIGQTKTFCVGTTVNFNHRNHAIELAIQHCVFCVFGSSQSKGYSPLLALPMQKSFTKRACFYHPPWHSGLRHVGGKHQIDDIPHTGVVVQHRKAGARACMSVPKATWSTPIMPNLLQRKKASRPKALSLPILDISVRMPCKSPSRKCPSPL